MSIYFIRHGQTNLNKSVSFNGEVEEELTEVGILQAQEAGKKLKDIKFDAIFCSPQLRTMQTLNALNIVSSVPIFFDERITERKMGNLAGKTIDFNYLRYDFLNVNANPTYDGLESIGEVFERVKSILEEIKQNYSNKNVLLVSHGFTGRMVYYYFNKLPKNGLLDDIKESFLSNCEIRKYDFNKMEGEKYIPPSQFGE